MGIPEVPRYDVSSHPGIGDFKNLTRERELNGQLLPQLQARESAARTLMAQIPEIIVPSDVDTRLHIDTRSDQGILLTAFDSFEGMEIAVPPHDYMESWQIQHEYNLMLANQLARIAAMQAVEARGFQAPPPLDEDNIIERTWREDRTILQLSDLGQNIDLATYNPGDLEEFEREAYFVEVESEQQVHRSEQFALGLPVMLGRQARQFFNGAAMPDINGSALSIATQAKMHMRVDIPEVGYYSDPKKGAALARSVFELLENDPMLENMPDEQKEWLLTHWKRNVFGALEVTDEKALRRANALKAEGVESWRVYGHTQGGDVVTTIRTLKNEYPDDEVWGSQITDIGIAFAAQNAGADAIITGVGSGGRCTTADQAQSVPANALFPVLARKHGLKIPIVAEGGAIDEPIIAALVGISGVNGSGSIGGGTFESPGGMYYLYKDGKYFKPYGGEASPRTKWISGRTFPSGLPYFPEGEQTFKQLNPLQSAIPQRVIEHQQRFILGPVTLRIPETPYIIEQIHKLTPLPLYRKSPTTWELQKTH